MTRSVYSVGLPFEDTPVCWYLHRITAPNHVAKSHLYPEESSACDIQDDALGAFEGAGANLSEPSYPIIFWGRGNRRCRYRRSRVLCQIISTCYVHERKYTYVVRQFRQGLASQRNLSADSLMYAVL
jgi:hypothetical protein